MIRINLLVFGLSVILCSAFSFYVNLEYFEVVPSVGDTLETFIFGNIFFSFLPNCILAFALGIFGKLSINQNIKVIITSILFYCCLQISNFLVFNNYSCQWTTCDRSLLLFHLIDHGVLSVVFLLAFILLYQWIWKIFSRHNELKC
jgi:hypothetical protein